MPLERYFKILQGRALAKFLIAKKKGILAKRVKEADEALENCELCERKCKVNRKKGERGICGVGSAPHVFGSHTHWGEEEELIPSATLFFSGCTLRCIYCQNAPQSVNYESGDLWQINDIVKWINQKAKQGCRNINFVGGDPTPDIPFILHALSKVKVNIPIVFNSNAYYSEIAANLIKDVVDVYLSDFRYFDESCAVQLSSAPNYPETAKRNHKLAEKHGELMIRLLVIPGHIECDAKPILYWIKQNLKNYRLNILAQYWPAHKAYKFPEISRRLTISEYNDVISYAREIGLEI